MDKLFGDASEKYLTRDQMTQLSYEINNNFKVVENYQMSEFQFSTTFIECLIGLSTDSAFKPVSFEKALESLSKYSMDFSEDLKPDQIKNELSNIFKIEQTSNKSHIIFDKKYYDELLKQSANSGQSSASAIIFYLGGGSKSSEYVTSNKDHWISKGSSLDDQLNQLNNYVENNIQYEFNGLKIVPKNLKVSKLQSSDFKKSLTFSRIKNVYFEADLVKDFTLSTRKSFLTPKFVSDLTYQLKVFKSSIAIVGQRELNYFDSNGKGFLNFDGWFICNVANGTPDLRGKFLVGRDERNGDFNNIGKTGGLSRVRLTVNEMPSHNHLDNGHSHYNNFYSNYDGSHSHEYKDIFYSENPAASSLINDLVDVPYSLGLDGRTDRDNKGWQFSRFTYNSGTHRHIIQGNSDLSRASITNTGGNVDHENLPPYYVVVYIINLKE